MSQLNRVIPPFEVAFDRLVARVGARVTSAQMTSLHAAFEHRTGAFGPDDPWFESRSRAFWDDVMTRQEVARAALVDVDEADAPWARALARSHRGLFRADAAAASIVLTDVLSGAELMLHDVDEASRDSLESTSGLFDGTVVALASPIRAALLPGAVFHPEGTEDAIAAVVTKARERNIPSGALLDALLRMELSLRTFSRVKPAYAYRAEALAV